MIVASAYLKDGVIYTGWRHDDIIRTQPCGFFSSPDCADGGFVTDKGKFLTRKLATEHAIVCGQVKRKNLIMPRQGLDSSDIFHGRMENINHEIFQQRLWRTRINQIRSAAMLYIDEMRSKHGFHIIDINSN